MNGAGSAHFLKAPSQRLPSTVESYGDIVQRSTQTCGQPFARLSQDIDTPNNVRILGLQGREQAIEAVAYRRVELGIGGPILDFGFVDMDLPAPPPAQFPLMIDNGCCEDATQPAAHGPDVSELGCTLERADREALQHLLRVIAIAQPPPQENKDLPPGLNERPADRVVMRPGGLLCAPALGCAPWLMVAGLRHRCAVSACKDAIHRYLPRICAGLVSRSLIQINVPRDSPGSRHFPSPLAQGSERFRLAASTGAAACLTIANKAGLLQRARMFRDDRTDCDTPARTVSVPPSDHPRGRAARTGYGASDRPKRDSAYRERRASGTGRGTGAPRFRELA